MISFRYREKDGKSADGSGKNKDGNSDEKKKDADKNKPDKNKPAKDSPDAEKSRQGKSSPGKPGSGKSKPDKSQQGQPSPGQPGPDGNDQQDSQNEQQNPDKQSPGQPSDQQSQKNNRTPGREEIEQARDEMQRAIEELKKQKNQDASGRQDEAIRKLVQAKEKLEEILRQLREEERELLLAALEARFQKMLAMQLLVNTGTLNLDKNPKGEWTSRHFGRARELAGQEDQIAREAAKALTLLEEEGSSIAFPEAVGQVRQDMLTVTQRLGQNETGELTQGIERDIVEGLQEMVEALQRELEKMKDKDKQQQQQQGGQPQDPSLLDTIAELKMLRTLQMRINRRTRNLGRLIKGDQATDPGVASQLKQLSERQARVQEATYDLAAGKNR